MKTLDNEFYIGFENEIDVDIYYLNNENEYVGLKLWDGYFENILSGCYSENIASDGLLKSYARHGGWYDESPWKVENISTAICELKQYDEQNIEPELKNLFLRLQEIRDKLLLLFIESVNHKKDIYISYDN